MELQLKPLAPHFAEAEVLATADGIRLAGDRWPGAAGLPELLYLHGFGQTRQAWHNSAAQLAGAGYGGLAVDGRGHGQSGRNPPGLAYSMDQFIADVQQVARGFARRPVLIGASMGGLLGVVTEGESDAGLYAALVLVDITPRWEAGGVARILDFMGAHPDGFADFDEAADAISRYLPHRRRRKTPAELAPLLVRRDDGRWVWHWDARMLDQVAREGERYQPRLIAAARRVQVPALLISGGLSDLVSDATVEEFLALVPHAEHVRIPDATHMVAGDRNDAFTGAILDFLTASRSRGAFGPGAVR